MDIKSILNSPSGDHDSAASPLPVSTQSYMASDVIVKRQKIAKDAPVFSEGNAIVDNVNYPPYEARGDRDLAARHREFRVFPLGQIHKKGVRHIPYNSEKKDFLDKTGRDAFEVFQYTYKRPGEDKEYVVVWDYNVGLVRMTPFFKSCKYSKTVPAKALRENPGLKDISYSITGGALVCQGYWMPFQAAREIAATFCWDIRWALTPVFGNDFPKMCRPPQHPGFAKFVIDPQIVRYCAAETNRFREEGTAYQLLLPKASLTAMESLMPLLSSPSWKLLSRAGDLESGYGSDVERGDRVAFSPPISPRSQCNRFTPINRAVSSISPHISFSDLSSPVKENTRSLQTLLTSNSETQCNNFTIKRTHSNVMCGGSEYVIDKVNASQARTTPLAKDLDESHPEEDSRVLEAAEALIMLSRGGVAVSEPKRTYSRFRN